MEAQVKFRVRDWSFTITGRGVGVIGWLDQGSLRCGQPVTVAIPGGDDGDIIEQSIVEAARLAEPPHELPGLIFLTDTNSAYAALLRRLLVEGTVLTLTGPGVVGPSSPWWEKRTLL
jgi:hypothetical protein